MKSFMDCPIAACSGRGRVASLVDDIHQQICDVLELAGSITPFTGGTLCCHGLKASSLGLIHQDLGLVCHDVLRNVIVGDLATTTLRNVACVLRHSLPQLLGILAIGDRADAKAGGGVKQQIHDGIQDLVGE